MLCGAWRPKKAVRRNQAKGNHTQRPPYAIVGNHHSCSMPPMRSQVTHLCRTCSRPPFLPLGGASQAQVLGIPHLLHTCSKLCRAHRSCLFWFWGVSRQVKCPRRPRMLHTCCKHCRAHRIRLHCLLQESLSMYTDTGRMALGP